jgi:hypothetical protein
VEVVGVEEPKTDEFDGLLIEGGEEEEIPDAIGLGANVDTPFDVRKIVLVTSTVLVQLAAYRPALVVVDMQRRSVLPAIEAVHARSSHLIDSGRLCFCPYFAYHLRSERADGLQECV